MSREGELEGARWSKNIEQVENPISCPHKPNCPGNCSECEGDALDAAQHVLQGR